MDLGLKNLKVENSLTCTDSQPSWGKNWFLSQSLICQEEVKSHKNYFPHILFSENVQVRSTFRVLPPRRPAVAILDLLLGRGVRSDSDVLADAALVHHWRSGRNGADLVHARSPEDGSQCHGQVAGARGQERTQVRHIVCGHPVGKGENYGIS